jgi:uncharacterized protein YecE (DUF72 family)
MARNSQSQAAEAQQRETPQTGQIHVGTSGWAYKAWQPDFYPEKLAQTKFLQHYATQLNTVEVNYTFRHLLTEKTIENWLKQTPENFQFVVKASQRITHIKRLKDVDDALGRFLSSVAPLASAGRLGPILFQLPPNMKAVPEVLDNFLTLLPRTLRAAFEFRHQSWFAPEIEEILRRHEAALCVAESDDFVTPEVVTAPFVYFRFRCSEYPEAVRAKLLERVLKVLEGGKEVFAFFKHEERPDGALWARELLTSVQLPPA